MAIVWTRAAAAAIGRGLVVSQREVVTCVVEKEHPIWVQIWKDQRWEAKGQGPTQAELPTQVEAQRRGLSPTLGLFPPPRQGHAKVGLPVDEKAAGTTPRQMWHNGYTLPVPNPNPNK